MTLYAGDKVLAIRIGTDKGLPVYATVDPCESPATVKALTVLLGVDNGLPVYGTADIKGTEDIVNGDKMLAVFLGVDKGLPVYGLPKYQCQETPPPPCPNEKLIVCIKVDGCTTCGNTGPDHQYLPGATVTLEFGRWSTPLDPAATFESVGTCILTEITGEDGCVCFDLNREGCGPAYSEVIDGVTWRYGYEVSITHPRNGTGGIFPFNYIEPVCGDTASCEPFEWTYLAGVNPPSACPGIYSSGYYCGACVQAWPGTIYWSNEYGTVTLTMEQYEPGYCGWVGYQTIRAERYTKARMCGSTSFPNPGYCVGCPGYKGVGEVTLRWIFAIGYDTTNPTCKNNEPHCFVRGYAKFVADECAFTAGGVPNSGGSCPVLYEGPSPTDVCGDEFDVECLAVNWNPFAYYRIPSEKLGCEPPFSIDSDCQVYFEFSYGFPVTPCVDLNNQLRIAGGTLSE